MCKLKNECLGCGFGTTGNAMPGRAIIAEY